MSPDEYPDFVKALMTAATSSGVGAAVVQTYFSVPAWSAVKNVASAAIGLGVVRKYGLNYASLAALATGAALLKHSHTIHAIKTQMLLNEIIASSIPEEQVSSASEGGVYL